MALPAGLRAVGHRDFRLFWCGQMISLIGTWMQSVGQAWVVLELTHSPFTMIVFMASSNTTVQVTVPDALRGRLMGLYAFVFVGMTPFGALLVGSIAEKWGVPATCFVGGGTGAALVLALTLTWRRRAAEAP